MPGENSKTSIMKKKVGPLTGTGWLIAGISVGVVYYVYSRIKGAGSASTGANVLAGGSGNPPANSVTSPASATPTFSTMGQWVDAAINDMTGNGLDPQDAFNAVQNWINGVCVSASQYQALLSPGSSQRM